MGKIIHTIPPVFDSASKVLILGSIPSPKSREAGFFYGHPRNRFWKILSAIFDEAIGETADEKTNFLLRHNIALWDTIKECEISGASDSSIRNAVINDFTPIFETADIKALFFTGNTSYKYFVKSISCSLPLIKLPSPSPANASYSLDRLINEYRIIKDYI